MASENSNFTLIAAMIAATAAVVNTVATFWNSSVSRQQEERLRILTLAASFLAPYADLRAKAFATCFSVIDECVSRGKVLEGDIQRIRDVAMYVDEAVSKNIAETLSEASQDIAADLARSKLRALRELIREKSKLHSVEKLMGELAMLEARK
jgi:hypothetical protein